MFTLLYCSIISSHLLVVPVCVCMCDLRNIFIGFKRARGWRRWAKMTHLKVCNKSYYHFLAFLDGNIVVCMFVYVAESSLFNISRKSDMAVENPT